ncbi:MAG: class I SAM-dependent methyltransferase, partial [Verrucomicrobiota bacterium]
MPYESTLSNQVLECDNVLELGCSAGEATARLLKRARRVVAVDKAEVMLAEARQKAPDAEILKIDCITEGDVVRDLAASADVVFLDLGGRMAMSNAVTVLQKLPSNVRLV